MSNVHQTVFKNLHLDDKSEDSLSKLWESIQNFIVHDLSDGFQTSDIYSLIVVVKNGLDVIVPDANRDTLKGYVVYVINNLLRDLIQRDILPRSVESILEQVPIAIVVDLISAVGGTVLTGRFGAASSADVKSPDFVRQNWVLRGK